MTPANELDALAIRALVAELEAMARQVNARFIPDNIKIAAYLRARATGAA